MPSRVSQARFRPSVDTCSSGEIADARQDDRSRPEAEYRASRDRPRDLRPSTCVAASTKHDIEAAQPRAATPARDRPNAPSATIEEAESNARPTSRPSEAERGEGDPQRPRRELESRVVSDIDERLAHDLRVRTRIARLEQPSAIVDTLGPTPTRRPRRRRHGISAAGRLHQHQAAFDIRGWHSATGQVVYDRSPPSPRATRAVEQLMPRRAPSTQYRARPAPRST